AEQRWDEVEQLLQAMTADGMPASKVQMLRAEVLLSRGQPEGARQLLEAERRRDPRQVEPWLFLAGLAMQEGKDVVPRLAGGERWRGRATGRGPGGRTPPAGCGNCKARRIASRAPTAPGC